MRLFFKTAMTIGGGFFPPQKRRHDSSCHSIPADTEPVNERMMNVDPEWRLSPVFNPLHGTRIAFGKHVQSTSYQRRKKIKARGFPKQQNNGFLFNRNKSQKQHGVSACR